MTLFEPAPVTHYVQIALNLPLRREFTYALPPGVTAQPGNRVRVQFHGRKLSGVVVNVSDTCDLPPGKVKSIDLVLDQELLLPASLLELSRRMSVTYGCSLGEALDATLPAAAKARASGAFRILNCWRRRIWQRRRSSNWKRSIRSARECCARCSSLVGRCK